MKKLFFFLLPIMVFLISCSKDDSTVTSSPQSNVFGSWQVETAQMVQAPPGSGISAVMKQALVTFGEMPASSVGWCNVSFNTDSTWSAVGSITNPAIILITGAIDSIYTAGGTFWRSGSNITFVVTNYSGSSGSQNTGTGTYALTDKLTINLNLANNEKWKIVLKK